MAFASGSLAFGSPSNKRVDAQLLRPDADPDVRRVIERVADTRTGVPSPGAESRSCRRGHDLCVEQIADTEEACDEPVAGRSYRSSGAPSCSILPARITAIRSAMVIAPPGRA